MTDPDATCETCGCPAEAHRPDSVHEIVWCERCGASTCPTPGTPIPSSPRVIPDPVTFSRHAWLDRLLGRPA